MLPCTISLLNHQSQGLLHRYPMAHSSTSLAIEHMCVYTAQFFSIPNVRPFSSLTIQLSRHLLNQLKQQKSLAIARQSLSGFSGPSWLLYESRSWRQEFRAAEKTKFRSYESYHYQVLSSCSMFLQRQDNESKAKRSEIARTNLHCLNKTGYRLSV